jgi:hypothetical protein
MKPENGEETERRRPLDDFEDDGDAIDKKIELLEFTYKEVLDATKHQDDKIGRLLTVIAFLTAGALALANLAGGNKVATVFAISPFRAPLTMLCLTVYLLTVFITVSLLVVSFGTPLRLPGIEPFRKQRRKTFWVNDIKASQIYFSEIAKVSVEQWREKWKGTESELKRERLDSFIKETHNLSLRTNFKYDRTTEALSVFSLALLAFSLAVGFAYLATTSMHAGDPSDPVEISVRGRILLASVLASYTFVQLLSRLREKYQAVDATESTQPSDGISTKVKGEWLFALTVPLAIGLSAASHPLWIHPVISSAIIEALALLSISALFMRFHGHSHQGPDKERQVRLPWWHTASAAIWKVAPVSVAAFLCILGVLTDQYGIQLLVAVLALITILLLGALNPTLAARRYRKRYLGRDAQ